MEQDLTKFPVSKGEDITISFSDQALSGPGFSDVRGGQWEANSQAGWTHCGGAAGHRRGDLEAGCGAVQPYDPGLALVTVRTTRDTYRVGVGVGLVNLIQSISARIKKQ